MITCFSDILYSYMPKIKAADKKIKLTKKKLTAKKKTKKLLATISKTYDIPIEELESIKKDQMTTSDVNNPFVLEQLVDEKTGKTIYVNTNVEESYVYEKYHDDLCRRIGCVNDGKVVMFEASDKATPP